MQSKGIHHDAGGALLYNEGALLYTLKESKIRIGRTIDQFDQAAY